MFLFSKEDDITKDAKYLAKIEKFMSKIPNKNIRQWLDMNGDSYKINFKLFDIQAPTLENISEEMNEDDVYQFIVNYLKDKGDYQLIKNEKYTDILHFIGQIEKSATILEQNTWDKNMANQLLGQIDFLKDVVIKLQKGLNNGKGHSKTKCK